MSAVPELTPQRYYRMPWSLTDNAISWLEVTDDCNLECEGCYRPHIKNHKSLAKIAEELAVFKNHRKSDCISIAGGDPLVHPQIVDIVRMVKQGGWKPIVNTNGLALSRKLLTKLKDAGVAGFTFHVDTTQVRKDSQARTEGDHNALRNKFAEMVAEAGGIGCSFNQTVSANTLDQVNETLAWARKHPDTVNTVVFILFRTPTLAGDFDYFANGKKVDFANTYDDSAWGGQRPLHAKDVVAKIREIEPDFTPSAYLSGTVDPQSTKWLISARLANRQRGFGYVGARFMETVQQFHHAFVGTWLSYAHPKSLRRGRLAAAVFSLLDPAVRRAAGRYLLSILKNPLSLRHRLHVQTITVIQPLDMLADGRMCMCDGCPDMTVHDGKLYWSCRLEEVKNYGCFVNASPRCIQPAAATTTQAEQQLDCTH